MTRNWPLKGDKRQKVWAEKLEFLENFWSFGELLEYFGGVFGERWRRGDRPMDMYGLYWFECGCIYCYTVSIGKYEVFTMWSFCRFRGCSGGLETLAEA